MRSRDIISSRKIVSFFVATKRVARRINYPERECIVTRFGFKEISPSNWLEPDDVLRGFVGISFDGQVRPLVAEDYLNCILRPNLHESIPEDVQGLFEVARGAMAYGYFFYPLFTLAMEQLFRVAEAAVVNKCATLGVPTSLKTFDERINWLVEKSIIPQSERESWEAVRHLRNMASHPERQSILPPSYAAGVLERIASQINSLFNDKVAKD